MDNGGQTSLFRIIKTFFHGSFIAIPYPVQLKC